MLKLHLQDDDCAVINALVDELSQRYESVESIEFQLVGRTYAAELSRRVRSALNEFRDTESSGVFLLTGLPIDDGELGPTLAHWKDRLSRSPTIVQDIAFFLVAGLLGDPIGWATQQDGRIMHDVFPIKEHEHEQIGWGSSELLAWHTEDAYHPLRADYLGLMCLRNPDNVETTFADVADVIINEETRKILSERRFYILPDESHRAQNQIDEVVDDPQIAELRKRSREQVEHALDSPEPVVVLFGDPRDPYLRIDPYYMQGIQGEQEQKALDAIGAAIDDAMRGVALQPGDICFVDNYRVVHGRKPFRARFDGTDRWLRRLNVTRDLRKSREFRISARSRVIY